MTVSVIFLTTKTVVFEKTVFDKSWSMGLFLLKSKSSNRLVGAVFYSCHIISAISPNLSQSCAIYTSSSHRSSPIYLVSISFIGSRLNESIFIGKYYVNLCIYYSKTVRVDLFLMSITSIYLSVFKESKYISAKLRLWGPCRIYIHPRGPDESGVLIYSI